VRRLALVAALVAASAFSVSAQAAPSIGALGGQCDGIVDVGCRTHVCQPDELDCGLVPPCFVWVAATGCLL